MVFGVQPEIPSANAEKKITNGIRRRFKTDMCEDNFAKHMKRPAKLALNLKHKTSAQTINASEWAIAKDRTRW